jgi:Mn2+/Fe2+ NRAMP family transporter
LIAMVDDNDAGGIATYTQAGQNCGMHLLGTLLPCARPGPPAEGATT